MDDILATQLNIEANGKISEEDIGFGVDFICSFSEELKQFDHRVTGSPQETACARAIRNRLGEETEAKVRMEAYRAHPLLGRAALPFWGLWSLGCFLLYFISFAGGRTAEICLLTCALVLFSAGLWLFAYLFLGGRGLSKLLSQKVCYNVVSETARNEEYAYGQRVIVITDNHDSKAGSFLKSPAKLRWVTLFMSSLASLVFLTFCVAKLAFGADTETKITVLSVIPAVIGVPGVASAFIHYSPLRRHAVGNNGVATALGMATYAYFAEQPELLPDDVKIVYASLGGENSGHNGSLAFVNAHPEFAGAYVLNVEDIVGGDIKVAEYDAVRRIAFSTEMLSAIRAVAVEQGVEIETVKHKTPAQMMSSLHGYASDNFAKRGFNAATLLATGDGSVDGEEVRRLFALSVGTVFKLFDVIPPLSAQGESASQGQDGTTISASKVNIRRASGK